MNGGSTIEINRSKLVLGPLGTSTNTNKFFFSTDLSGTDFYNGNISTGASTTKANKIEFNGTYFVAVGTSFDSSDSTKCIAYSIDGKTWTAANITGTSTTEMYDVKWNGSSWLAVGLEGKYATSTDSINWTIGAPLSATNTTQPIYCVCWHLTKWIVGAKRNTSPQQPQIWTSPDAVTWTRTYFYGGGPPGQNGGVFAIATNGTTIVALVGAGNSAPIYIYSSDNGVSWIQPTGVSAIQPNNWGTDERVTLIWACSPVNRFIYSGINQTNLPGTKLWKSWAGFPAGPATSWESVNTVPIYGGSVNNDLVTLDLKWDGSKVWLTNKSISTVSGVAFYTTNINALSPSFTTVFTKDRVGFPNSGVTTIAINNS